MFTSIFYLGSCWSVVNLCVLFCVPFVFFLSLFLAIVLSVLRFIASDFTVGMRPSFLDSRSSTALLTMTFRYMYWYHYPSFCLQLTSGKFSFIFVKYVVHNTAYTYSLVRQLTQHVCQYFPPFLDW